jgi:hypothetical protein
MRKTMVMFGVCVLALSGLAAAQTGAAHPGYFAIEDMGVLAKDDLEVDVNLEGAMLQVAAGAMEEESSDLAEMVAQLERVRVLVGAPESADRAAVTASFNAAISRLETSGWDQILSVEEEDEQVYIFAREIEGAIAGLTVLVNDSGEEIVVVNIVGNIDPRVLGRLIANMDEMPDLEQFMNMGD